MAQITILNQGNIPQGPFNRDQVAQKLAAGEFTLDSLAHVDGLSQWTPLREVLTQVDVAAPSVIAPPPVTPPAYSYAATMQPPPDVVFAGFWLRFAAIFIDGLIVGIPTIILSGIIGGIYGYFYAVSHPGGKVGLMDADGNFNGSFVLMELGVTIFSMTVR